jgi:hypothetical protein
LQHHLTLLVLCLEQKKNLLEIYITWQTSFSLFFPFYLHRND